jgi:hypothetical protein
MALYLLGTVSLRALLKRSFVVQTTLRLYALAPLKTASATHVVQIRILIRMADLDAMRVDSINADSVALVRLQALRAL